jgi:HlyD family secretion protein
MADSYRSALGGQLYSKATPWCVAVAAASLVIPLEGLSQTLTSPGRVEAARPTMTIGTAATGVVSKILVQEGSHVGVGQPLAVFDCTPIEADVRGRQARLAAAQAVFDRVRNGPRPDEIAVGEAVVGDSAARADEAKKTLDRTTSLQEGITVSRARVLEVERDARIGAAQLQEARARLSLLKAGSREEDIRQAQALEDAAAADLDSVRAQLDRCTVRAPADGVVAEIMATQGQYYSTALPQPLLRIVPDGPLLIRAEVAAGDASHICASQRATITADALPDVSISGQVTSISPTLVAPTSGTAAASQDNEVLPVVLTIASGSRPLPIGSTVTVRFAACPSRS